MLKATLKKYITIQETVPPILTREVKTLAESVEQINNESDTDQLAKMHRTGQEIPEPYDYEPYVTVMLMNIY